MRRPARIVLDINVWVASLLSRASGRSRSATQDLVRFALTGQAPAQPLRLVISEYMLATLGQVLFRRLIRAAEVDLLIDSIRLAAEVQVTLGAGVLALPDGEDARVLETALAGEAHYLVTADINDFGESKDARRWPGGVLCIPRPSQPLVIITPATAMAVFTRNTTYRAWERRRLAETWVG